MQLHHILYVRSRLKLDNQMQTHLLYCMYCPIRARMSSGMAVPTYCHHGRQPVGLSLRRRESAARGRWAHHQDLVLTILSLQQDLLPWY